MFLRALSTGKRFDELVKLALVTIYEGFSGATCIMGKSQPSKVPLLFKCSMT